MKRLGVSMMKAVTQLRVTRRQVPLGIPRPGPLRLQRFEAGLRLQDVAQAAAMSMSRASRIERGIAVDPRDAAVYAEALTRLAQEPRP